LTSAALRKRRHQQQIAFSKALQEHDLLRVAWLATLRSFSPHSTLSIPVAPEDETELLEIDKVIPQDWELRLKIVHRCVWEKVPEVARLFTSDQEVGLFLLGTLARKMTAEEINPFWPWERRGRPRQSGNWGNDEAVHRRIVQLIRQLSATGYPSQERVAERLGMDAANLRRLCRRSGTSWSALLRAARQPD
jgi:hypothetical protein